MKRIVLITGGNRGIGYETARQMAQQEFKIWLSSRDESKGEKAVDELKRQGLDVSFVQMDVTNIETIKKVRHVIEETDGRLDVLINNAGIYLDEDISIKDLEEGIMEDTFATNYFGPYYTMRTFIPLMEKQGYGRIINVSSGYGSYESTLSPQTASYKLSKYSLNGLTRMMANAVDKRKIKINALCPGWVRTDMGGPHASIGVEEVPKNIIWLATLEENGPTGQFFRDKKQIAW